MKINKNKYALIGAKIKKVREADSISQKELADSIGFESATAISLIEAGERKVSIVDLEKIAEKLGKNMDYFLETEGKPVDVKFALRADKNLSKDDKKAILRFVELAKKQKHGR